MLESTFCLKMDGLNCSVPLTSERLDLSQIVSIENGIRITPGVYIAEICDIDGNTIAGGEAKTIRVSGLIKSTSRD